MALTNKLTAIADAIREKTNTTEAMTLEQMATAISGITGGGGVDIPEEAFYLTGSCMYRFSNNNWNWFVEDFGDKIITEDLVNGGSMFANSGTLKRIPFELNFKVDNVTNIDNSLSNCRQIKTIPKINNIKINSLSQLFMNCNNVREIPEDIDATWDWSQIDGATSQYTGDRKSCFEGCYSLRSFPMSFFNHGNPIVSNSYTIYNGTFKTCSSLDEVIGMPFPHYNATWTGNAFTNLVTDCYRLKNFTFALQEDGNPYVVNWKSQVLDFNAQVGFGQKSFKNRILDYNSGITEDKEVKDDATYAALKNDPDWYTLNKEYSRYNHDSAVATINSLPDTSAYLATAGGTNTIKFRGEAGSLTDGGAINTLTEEEIAVATARGWTVTLV